MSPKARELSAFLPVHDERENLVATVEGLLSALSGLCERFEVVIVDDGSTDGSGERADELARLHPEVRVVRHPANRGYGAAVRTGLAACRHELIFLMDADGQFDPRDLRDLLPLAGSAELVLGWRLRRADGPHRRLFGAGWNALVRLALGVKVRDVNCAFKLMRAGAVRDLDLRCRGAAISAELLFLAGRRGAAALEVPVSHYPRRGGRASGASPAIVAAAFGELAGLVRRRLSA